MKEQPPRCAICFEPKSEMRRLSGFFGQTPVAVCERCMEAVQKLVISYLRSEIERQQSLRSLESEEP